jgi:hypothetical protein
MTGSHDSLTCGKEKWYIRSFTFMSDTQSLLIEQQYLLGVRFFDIRVRFDNKKIPHLNPYAAHGLAKSNIDIWKTFDYLNIISTGEIPIYIRVMYEDLKPFYKCNIENFEIFLSILYNEYKNLYFVTPRIKSDFSIKLNLDFVPIDIPIINCHGQWVDYTKTGIKKLLSYRIPFIKDWCKKYNQTFKTIQNEIEPTNKIIFSYDYIEI